MTTVGCGGPGCKNPVVQAATGRPAKFCSTRCRVAASRAAPGQPAEEAAIATPDTRAGYETPQRPSGKARRVGLLCPVDPDHGPLLPWTHNPDFGWYCPDQAHDGHRDRPQTRAFFRTDEAEAGSLMATAR